VSTESTILVAAVLNFVSVGQHVKVADPSERGTERSGVLQSVKHDRYGVYVEIMLDDGGFWAKTISENAKVATTRASDG